MHQLILVFCLASTVITNVAAETPSPQLSGACVLPAYPEHGTYFVVGDPRLEPHAVLSAAVLNVTCEPGYEVSGMKELVCFNGIWSGEMPNCMVKETRCILPPYPAHGSYIISGMPSAAPGQAFDTVAFNVTCDSGYEINGKSEIVIVCFSGQWSEEIKDCMPSPNQCILPPFPAHGSYIVAGISDVVPGQALASVALNITCDPGFDFEGEKQRVCFGGIWSENMTDCMVLCPLKKDPSVEYRCLHPNAAMSEWQWTRECYQYEHHGTTVKPQCKKNYYFPVKFNSMRCMRGKWNYVARCIPVTTGTCVLPPFPAHGTYVIAGLPKAEPGQALASVSLTINCLIGYAITGKKVRTCYNGIWSGEITDCKPLTDLCIVPPHPTNGNYTVLGNPNAIPDQAFDSLVLKVTCNSGYKNYLKGDITCHNGKWSQKIEDCLPEAIRGPSGDFQPAISERNTSFCRLEKDPSVNYRCLLSAASKATRECNLTETIGTLVRPECKVPNYYFPGILNHMRCVNGEWNYIARCVPECGLVTPKGTRLVIGGRPAERGELPWHAGIYRKDEDMTRQICGGSIISQKVVISAGHCFMSGGIIRQPASLFAVAVGKLYRNWTDERDEEVQKSDLSELVLPPRFRGSITNFQEDIALLLLKVAIVYQTHVRPICVDFNTDFEWEQLLDGSLGKVAGWGLISEHYKLSSTYLKVVELPVVPIDECQADAPLHFREYITGDKICAGYRNGTAVCKGDSGGGLAFPRNEDGKTRFYLRGLVSTAPNNNTLCNSLWLTMFTQVSRHERFIKDHVRF